MAEQFVVIKMRTLTPDAASSADEEATHQNREIQSVKVVPEGVELTKGPTHSIIKCSHPSVSEIVVRLVGRVARGHRATKKRVDCVFVSASAAGGGGGGGGAAAQPGANPRQAVVKAPQAAREEARVEIWERQRNKFGWTSKLLPTDRSAFVYKEDGKDDGWDELKQVPVKRGWEWKDSWASVNPSICGEPFHLPV
jgi:hypothetical protein